MNDPTQSRSEGFLVAALAYCLTWELAGRRARESWGRIRHFVKGDGGLTERERWIIELYEDSAPIASEERSVLFRIEPLLTRPREIVRLGEAVVALLPDKMHEAAMGHSLVRGFKVPKGYSGLRNWISGKRASSIFPVSTGPVPLAEREEDFERFLEMPGFVETFRCFWHAEPKRRTSAETQSLVSLSAALAQMAGMRESAQRERLFDAVYEICHFSTQTRRDIAKAVEIVEDEFYDAEELACRIFTDVPATDRKNFARFTREHIDELADFAGVLLKFLEIDPY